MPPLSLLGTASKVAAGAAKAFSSANSNKSAQADITNSGYTYVDNGNGGVNYFYKGKPITNTQYRNATGLDTNGIEAYIAQRYQNNKAGASAGAPVQSLSYTDPTASAAAAEAAQKAGLVRDRLNSVNSKLDNYKSLFGALYGNIDSAAADQVNTAKGKYAGQRTDLTNDYNAQVPAIDLSYYLSGIGDSSLRLGSQGKAENTFKSGLGTIDNNERDTLTGIGQTVATKKAGYQADEANIDNIRAAASQSTDPSELLSLGNDIDTKIGGLRADAAGFQTGGQYRAALPQATTLDLAPIHSTLTSLVNGGANPALKSSLATNIINNSGATDEQKKTLFQQYVTG